MKKLRGVSKHTGYRGWGGGRAVRALTGLAGDPSSVPGTYTRQTPHDDHLSLQLRGDLPHPASAGPTHAHAPTHTHSCPFFKLEKTDLEI